MISSILMKGVASYKDEGVTFNAMDKVNLIFGSNSTGKTTISSFMKEYGSTLEKGTAIDDHFAQCEVRWSDDRRQKILVYNRHSRLVSIVTEFGENTL